MRANDPVGRLQGSMACVLSLAMGLSAASLGCGDDETSVTQSTTTSSGGNGQGGTAQGGGGQGGGGGETLVVEVGTSAFGALGEFVPVAGATVAFDKPGGERVELTSGADGTITFDGIDWSLGEGTMTAYLEDHVLWSYLGLTPESLARYIEGAHAERLRFLLLEQGPSTVAASGTATGMANEAHRLYLGANTAGSSSSDHAGPDWSLYVASGEPFALVGFEYHMVSPATVSARGEEFALDGWASLEHEAITEETSGLTFDMTNALAPTHVSGSFPLPLHGISDFFETAQGGVRASAAEFDGSLLLGLPTHLDVSTDGTAVEYDVEHVSPSVVAAPMTNYALWDSEGRGAGVQAIGYPSAGEQDFVVPEPVTLTNEESIAPYDTTLGWEMNEVDATDSLLTVNSWVSLRSTGVSAWYVRLPRGATEMTLPALPSNVDADAVFGTGSLAVIVQLCEERSTPVEYAGYCARYSASKPFYLTH